MTRHSKSGSPRHATHYRCDAAKALRSDGNFFAIHGAATAARPRTSLSLKAGMPPWGASSRSNGTAKEVPWVVIPFAPPNHDPRVCLPRLGPQQHFR